MLLIMLISTPINAAKKPNVIKHNDFCSDLAPAYKCPALSLWNRTNQYVLAVYTPRRANQCNQAGNSQWRLAHPNNAYGIGFTAQDWEDLEVAKVRTKGNYRWGCCFSDQQYDAICLY